MELASNNGDMNLVRGLAMTYSRNQCNATLRTYIEDYLAVQVPNIPLHRYIFG
jgi:hypothetical protein